MAIFCYKCKECDERFMDQTHGLSKCPYCGKIAVVRDYKAETKTTLIPAYMRAGASDKSDFLPSEKDFESPTDPTGEKGMKEWKDTHKVKGSTWV